MSAAFSAAPRKSLVRKVSTRYAAAAGNPRCVWRMAARRLFLPHETNVRPTASRERYGQRPGTGL